MGFLQVSNSYAIDVNNISTLTCQNPYLKMGLRTPLKAGKELVNAEQAQNYSQFPTKTGLIQKEKLRSMFCSLVFTFHFPHFSSPKDSPKLSHL